ALLADLDRLSARGAPPPDLVVVTGDMTRGALPSEFRLAHAFLARLADRLGLGPQRGAIVPRSRDVSHAACQAYFPRSPAREIQPTPPFWPKWRHFSTMFDALYHGVDGPVFDAGQPWTLFELEDLKVAIAGLNSTMAETHLPDDRYGWLGEDQLRWFRKRLQW